MRRCGQQSNTLQTACWSVLVPLTKPFYCCPRRCMKHSSQEARHTKMLVNLRFAGRPYKDPHTFTCAAPARTPVTAACEGAGGSQHCRCSCWWILEREGIVRWPLSSETRV